MSDDLLPPNITEALIKAVRLIRMAPMFKKSGKIADFYDIILSIDFNRYQSWLRTTMVDKSLEWADELDDLVPSQDVDEINERERLRNNLNEFFLRLWIVRPLRQCSKSCSLCIIAKDCAKR